MCECVCCSRRNALEGAMTTMPITVASAERRSYARAYAERVSIVRKVHVYVHDTRKFAVKSQFAMY